jgi:glycosyltransferase involved in cell wall biosynthesis
MNDSNKSERCVDDCSKKSEKVEGSFVIDASTKPTPKPQLISHSINIEKPMDGMSIKSLIKREKAWKKFAIKQYSKQPTFMKNGKERFDALVEYDPLRNQITWDHQPLPGTSCWKSNCHYQEKLGQIVLVLMVKNESKIIERLLGSLIDDIDGFIILDTGSTDNTQQLMWDFLVTKHKKRGAIYTSPFWDFSSCRTITVQLAYNRGDFLALMDADYKLVKMSESGEEIKNNDSEKDKDKNQDNNESSKTNKSNQEWRTKLPSLNPKTNGALWLMLETVGDLAYSRPHIVSGYTRWHYACRTHEHLSKSRHDTNPHPMEQRQFNFLKIDHVGDGGSKADKLPRDVVLLLMDLIDNPKSERAYFYLGNSLKQLHMFDWALRSYKSAMNLCGWREEMYCSAKSVMECLDDLHGLQMIDAHERKLMMVLHGITQDPVRLELLAEYLKRNRSGYTRRILTKDDWQKKHTHIGSLLCAFFAHNVYPVDEKLFVQRWDHDFGFWQEVSIVTYQCPQYFELGVFAVQKMLNHPEFSKQTKEFQKQVLEHQSLFDEKLDKWRKEGILVTKAIRAALITAGHKLFAQSKFTQAYSFYEACLHTVVHRSQVPHNILTTIDEAQNKIEILKQCESIKSETFHKFHRLTAWKNAQILSPVVTERDHDCALACFQMAKCQEQMTENNHWNKMQCAFLYADALKFVPLYPLATAALYQLSIMMPSCFTRCVLYLLRLVSASSATHLALPLARTLGTAVQVVNVDESVMTQVVQYGVSDNNEIGCGGARVAGSKSIVLIQKNQNINFSKNEQDKRKDEKEVFKSTVGKRFQPLFFRAHVSLF